MVWKRASISGGVELDPFFRSNDNGVLQAMVAAGSGVALLPRLAIDESDEHVTVMSGLAKVLVDPAQAERLRSAADADAVLSLLAPEEETP